MKLPLIVIIMGCSFCFKVNADGGWFAATHAEMAAVYNCTKLPSVEEMEKQLSKLYHIYPTDIDTFNIDGFVLKNTSIQTVLDLNGLTSDRSLFSSIDAKNLNISESEMQSKSKKRIADELDKKYGRTYDLSAYQGKAPNCSDILCAVKNIFGPTGIEVLWAYKMYGLNLSRYQFVHGINFDQKEADGAIRAISLLPAHLMAPITEDDKGFFRFKKGYTMASGGGDGVVANAFGAVFDAVDDYDAPDKVYVFVHEMGHRSARLKEVKEDGDSFPREMDKSSEWLKASGWKVSGKTDNQLMANYYEHVGGRLVSQYAGTNPAEDFAETFAAYRFAPNRLKKISPQRYQYMRANVFNGIEYTEDICRGSRPRTGGAKESGDSQRTGRGTR